MPSWNDGETSSDDSLLTEFASGADLSPVSRVPESIYDPEYRGVHDGPQRCLHHLACHRYVAFDGTDTGRRFLGCGCKDKEICETVHWVDQEWAPPLKRSLLKVWQMYEEEKDTRISGNVDYATANYQLVLEKRELEKKNLELHKQLGNMCMEQESVVNKSAADLDKVRREKAELQVCTLMEEKKEAEMQICTLMEQKQMAEMQICTLMEQKKMADVQISTLKEQKKKVEYAVADLLNVRDKNKKKMKAISELCASWE